MPAYRVGVFRGLLFLVCLVIRESCADAGNMVSVPIFVDPQESGGSDMGTFVMDWDQGSAPDPLRLQWQASRVTVHGTALEPLLKAFDYATAFQSATVHLTGTLSLSTTVSTPLNDEGVSTGAALAIGFLAVLRGERLTEEIAIVGALEPTGRIGQVRRLASKIRAAARQGYRMVLIPRGQRSVPSIRLVGMGVDPNITVHEVGTIEEAYAIMTGR